MHLSELILKYKFSPKYFNGVLLLLLLNMYYLVLLLLTIKDWDRRIRVGYVSYDSTLLYNGFDAENLGQDIIHCYNLVLYELSRPGRYMNLSQ